MNDHSPRRRRTHRRLLRHALQDQLASSLETRLDELLAMREPADLAEHPDDLDRSRVIRSIIEADDREAVASLTTEPDIADGLDTAYAYRARWVDASARIVADLLAERDAEDVINSIPVLAKTIAEADLAVIGRLSLDGSGIDVVAADGPGADRVRGGQVPLAAPLLRDVCRAGRMRATTATRGGQGLPLPSGMYGPVLAVPFGLAEGPWSCLLVARLNGRSMFAGPVKWMVREFTAEVAAALELTERSDDIDRLVTLSDREQVTDDLRGNMRRLAESSHRLAGIVARMDESQTGELRGLMVDLDETIDQLNETLATA